MIITVGGQKGGTGKSTISAELAIYLSSQGTTLLVDSDEQGTITEFTNIRNEQNGSTEFTAIQLTDKSISSQIPKFKNMYDYIVIDAGGFDSLSQRHAIGISDKYLAVFNPESLVLWTTDSLEMIIEQASAINPKIKCFSCLNKGWPSGQDNEDSAQYLKESSILNYLPHVIVRRKAFCDATGNGLTVKERKPTDKKAIEEMNNLISAIIKD